MENIEKINKLDLAVKVSVDWLKFDLAVYRKNGWEIENWGDMLNAFGQDSTDMRRDIEYMLMDYTNKQYEKGKSIDISLNGYHELIDENGNIITYRQLTNAIRKELKKQGLLNG